MKQTFFMSFGSLHTGKNLGCCLVQVADGEDPNRKCFELGLMPDECNQARAYLLDDEDIEKQHGMQIGRFYSSAEMRKMGFQKA